MSGIAELLLRLGYRVTGSDIRSSDITRRLESLGCEVREGHAAGHAAGADIVVVSNAIPPDNPEVLAAGENSTPVIPRAEMLAELMRFKYGVAISGAHGKTSTTSVVASILGEGGLDPTVVIGGKLKSVGYNAVLGQGDFIVAEADESDGSFLRMSPSIAVVTNIDREHLDFYKDLDEIKDAFARFIDGMPFYGLAVLCADDPHVRELIPGIKKRFTTYGTSPGADLEVTDIEFDGLKTVFQVARSGERLGDIRLNLPGFHNARNAAAGIAVGLELGVSFDKIRSALEGHRGVERRLEIKGEVRGILVVDDYGHHPTEIETTLDALEKSFPERRVAALFQPHRHTRTRALFDEFSRVFHRAGVVYALPVYAAGEKAVPGSDSRELAAAIEKESGVPAFYVKDFDAAALRLGKELGNGDILLTLGAGDVWKAGERFIRDAD